VTKHRTLRLIFVLLVLLGTGLSSWLIIRALKENISFYYTPTEAITGKVSQGVSTRFGGIVKPRSLDRLHGLEIRFILTDNQHDIPVVYSGILPDLFKEGQGVVVTGFIDENGVLKATELLAKHDENYLPPKITHAPTAQTSVSPTVGKQ
jgi:cytochrome c-type biogenesis protein CcmE